MNSLWLAKIGMYVEIIPPLEETHPYSQSDQWADAQKTRLVLQHIRHTSPKNDDEMPKPNISLVTEAGILSKSGINSRGVSVFLNAIQARGVNFAAVPIHVALRMVLESNSRIAAVSRLSQLGFGTSGNILIADPTGGTCLEFSHVDVVELQMLDGQLAHTNHFLAAHGPRVKDNMPWPDTLPRMKRVTDLLSRSRSHCNLDNALATVEGILEDEDGFPTSINRQSSEGNESSTLFSIAVDLLSMTGRVRVGRPSHCDATYVLQPAEL